MAVGRSRSDLLKALGALIITVFVTFVYLLLSLDHLQRDLPVGFPAESSPVLSQRPLSDAEGRQAVADIDFFAETKLDLARSRSPSLSLNSKSQRKAVTRWWVHKGSIKEGRRHKTEGGKKCNCSDFNGFKSKAPYVAEGRTRRRREQHVNFHPAEQNGQADIGLDVGREAGGRGAPGHSHRSDLQLKIQRASTQLKEVLSLLERIKTELNASSSASPERRDMSERLRSGIQVVGRLINSLSPGGFDSPERSTPEALEPNGAVGMGSQQSRRPTMNRSPLLIGDSREQEIFCGETFKGTLYGYPFYERGFVASPCPGRKPLHQLITMIFNFVDYPPMAAVNVMGLLRQVRTLYPQVAIVVAVRRDAASQVTKAGDYIVLEVSDGQYRPAAVWNTLMARVTTPFVFLGRDVLHFDSDANLERLLLQASSQSATLAAGATRTDDGRWVISCHQVAYRNFTLAYRHGYYHSKGECLRCSSINGPFVVRTDLLRNNSFDEALSVSTLFDDYFLTLRGLDVLVLLCPDAMFHVRFPDGLRERRSAWLVLATKWRLNRIRLESGTLHTFTCADVHMDCAFTTGLAVPPCCLDMLAAQIKFIMNTCEQKHIVCELQEGSLLGTVKLGKVLPWERDGDVTFLSSNFTAVAALTGWFRAAGYLLEQSGSTRCCVEDRLAGGAFTVRGIHSPWTVEMYGHHRTDSEALLQAGQRPTRLFFDGAWVSGPRNPGRHVRNRYGHEIYRHAQHWISLGKYNGWDEYVPSGFTACPLPGRHDCLDLYSVDGNLQFEEPIP